MCGALPGMCSSLQGLRREGGATVSSAVKSSLHELLAYLAISNDGMDGVRRMRLPVWCPFWCIG